MERAFLKTASIANASARRGPGRLIPEIDRSGLGRYFDRAVVGEKDPDAYRALAGELGVDPAKTWMVGNSPKSDVNAALAAGLNAVYVPHPSTWRLEHQDLATGPGQLLVLGRFAELRDRF